MTIDFKGYFQNKNHRQRKINDLGMLESRRWVRTVATMAKHNRSIAGTKENSFKGWENNPLIFT